MESRVLGALSKVDEFLPIPLVRVQSGTSPENFRFLGRENQEYNEDLCQNDPQTSNKSEYFDQQIPSLCEVRPWPDTSQ